MNSLDTTPTALDATDETTLDVAFGGLAVAVLDDPEAVLGADVEDEADDAELEPAGDLFAEDLDDEPLSDDPLGDALVQRVNDWEYEDFNFEQIFADMDMRDVSEALRMLEAYRLPFTRAARRAGFKNPAAEFYNATNRPLFTRRIALKNEVAQLSSAAAAGTADEADEFVLMRSNLELETLTELIVRLNYGMTRKYVKQFTSNTSAEDSADFQSAAHEGLMVAIDRFDPTKGKFGSWAYKPIQRAVLNAVHQADFKNLNEGDFEKRPKVLRAYNKLMEKRIEGDPAPTYEEVAAEAGLHHGLVARVLAAPHLDSIHTAVGEDGSSELGDLIPDPEAAFEDTVISKAGIEALMEFGLSELDPREHYVLTRVFGLDGEQPDALADIGTHLKLSREAVRQIRGKAMAKLLHPVTLRRLVRGGRD